MKYILLIILLLSVSVYSVSIDNCQELQDITDGNNYELSGDIDCSESSTWTHDYLYINDNGLHTTYALDAILDLRTYDAEGIYNITYNSTTEILTVSNKTISNSQDLSALADNRFDILLNDHEFSFDLDLAEYGLLGMADFNITIDITLENINDGFIPIDIDETRIDGMGYTISNVYQNHTLSRNDHGLFEWIANSDVRNLSLSNFHFIGGDGYLFADTISQSNISRIDIAGYTLESFSYRSPFADTIFGSDIREVTYSNNDLTETTNNCFADTIQDSTLTDVEITCTITPDRDFGGLAYESDTVTITRSSVVSIVNPNDDLDDIGGLIARPVDTTIENSFSLMEVDFDGTNTFVLGGLLGDSDGTMTITNSYAVLRTNNVGIIDDVGGLVGLYTNDGDAVTSSYYDGEELDMITNNSFGTPLTTAEMQNESSFTGWDFAAIWSIDNSYPYFDLRVCTDNFEQACFGSNVYWFDSCGNRQTLSDNCSVYDLEEINSCTYDPDNDPLTLDFAASFQSTCVVDACTTSTYSFTHTCNITCGAECENDIDCDDGEPNTIDTCTDCMCENVWNCAPSEEKECFENNVYWLDTCGNRTGLADNCSDYDLTGVSNCSYIPDNNPFTLDFAAGFTSICEVDACTQSELTFSHTCNLTCGAECIENLDCDDGNQYTDDVCSDCSCTNEWNCTINDHTECFAGDSYWYDSCERQENLHEACDFGCKDGSCTSQPYFPGMEWNKTFGGASTEIGESLKVTDGFIMTGYYRSFANDPNYYAWLLKTDPEGNHLWNNTYGGAGFEQGVDVVEMNGSYVMLGHTTHFQTVDKDAILLVKTDTDGNLIWKKQFNKTKNIHGEELIVDSLGRIIIVGKTETLSDYTDILAMAVDQDGDVVWEKNYSRSSSESGNSIIENPEGYMIMGQQGLKEESDLRMMQIDFDGNHTWNRSFGGVEYDNAFSIISTDDGYVIAGAADKVGTEDRDCMAVKTDKAGNVLWTKTMGGPEGDGCLQVTETSKDRLLFTGYTESFGSGYYDAWMIVLNQRGDHIWNKTFGKFSTEWGYYATETADEGIIFVGATSSYGAGGLDLWLFKLNNDSMACTPRNYTQCFGADIFWYDSCGYREGVAEDCSFYDIAGVNQCDATPDDNPYTRDIGFSFISTCRNDACTTGTQTLTHECDIACGAECEIDSDCENGYIDGCINADLDGKYNDFINYTDFNCNECFCDAPQYNITYNDNVNCECEPSWVLNGTWSECMPDDHQYRYYIDLNECGEAEPTPVNQTCDYCVPDWMEKAANCTVNNTLQVYNVDYNNCYALTNLSSDNNAPENVTNECDYCVPDWIEVNSSCAFDNTSVGYYVDNNSCFDMTGFQSDLENKPANNTYECVHCVQDWLEYYTNCSIDDTYQGYFIDNNTCFESTGLQTYNNTPADINYTCDYCTPNWTQVNNTCGEDDKYLSWYNDTNGCYAITNLTSDMNNTNSTHYCDYSGDGMIGNISDVNTNMDLTYNFTNGTFRIFDNGTIIMEFKLNGSMNFYELNIHKQVNGSGFMMVSGLNISNKTIYLDRTDNTSSTICIKDDDITNISDITSKCDGDLEFPMTCPANSTYSCSFVDNKTRYKVSGLMNSAIKEQGYCGDGIVQSGEQCDGGSRCTSSCTKKSTSSSSSSSSSSGGGIFIPATVTNTTNTTEVVEVVNETAPVDTKEMTDSSSSNSTMTEDDVPAMNVANETGFEGITGDVVGDTGRGAVWPYFIPLLIIVIVVLLFFKRKRGIVVRKRKKL